MSTILFVIGIYFLIGGTATITLYYDNPFVPEKDDIEGLYVALLWPYSTLKYIVTQLRK